MSFKISCKWQKATIDRSDPTVSATLAALRISIADKNVTEWLELSNEDDSVPSNFVDQIEIPAYFLAEWLAENWWPLLYEPKKSDDDAEDLRSDFYLRHAIVHAQNGFGLPDVRIVPTGKSLKLFCKAHTILSQDAKFPRTAEATLPRANVERVLEEFVGLCVSRLNEAGIVGTPLQEAWAEISSTTTGQTLFCKLAGALGINPYFASDEIAGAIDLVHETAGTEAALDLCQASSEEEILRSQNRLSLLVSKLEKAERSTLEPLANFVPRSDSLFTPSWRRGVNAAKAIRALLDINVHDYQGVDKLFDIVKVNTDEYFAFEEISTESEEGVLASAVDRSGADARFILMPPKVDARRFAASRAIFLALNECSTGLRFATRAVTRDQQASRAFAAELMAPYEFVKSKAKRGRISLDTIAEIAERRRVSPEVVRHQATNNGLQVA